MSTTSFSLTDILGGNMPTNTGIEIADCESRVCPLVNAVIVTALSGLTGVRAFIPIFVVALGNQLDPNFPVALTDGGWLSSWPAIIALGTFLLIEMIIDCFPACDEIQDAVMLILKPAIGIFLAVSPVYGEAGSSQALTYQIITAVNSGLISEVMALLKALETVAVDVGSGGIGAPVRSVAEDFCVTAAAYLIITVGFALAATMIVIMVSLLCCWGIRRKMRGKSLIPRCWCCKLCEDDDSDNESVTTEDPDDIGWNRERRALQ